MINIFLLPILAYAASVPQKLLGDGMLFHSIDFGLRTRTPSDIVDHWSNNPDTSLYLSSFSYVNSANPKVANIGASTRIAGILIDPKHPDVKVHAMAPQNAVFNSVKLRGNLSSHKTPNACDASSSQFPEEKRMIDMACQGGISLKFDYANECYSASPNACSHFNRGNMIQTLKANNQNSLNWNEIVASVPFHAISGVIDFQDPTNGGGLDNPQRITDLCTAMRTKIPGIPCYRASIPSNPGGITPFMMAASPPPPPTPPPNPTRPLNPTPPPTRIPISPAPAGTQPTSHPPPEPESEDPTTKNRSNVWLWLLLLLIPIVIGSAAFGIYKYMKSKERRKEKDYPIETKDEDFEDDTALSVSSLSLSSSLTLRKRRSAVSFETI